MKNRDDYCYQDFQAKIQCLDLSYLKDHNAIHGEKSPYHLHDEIPPCPFEGNLETAKIILLLANPHYLPGRSTANDHKILDGWGIWGLSSKSSASMHRWWRPRLRRFVKNLDDEGEWQRLSHKFASFQAVAWASERFHSCNSLPSKQLMADALQKLVRERSDVIFVVMRQRAYWSKLLHESGARVIHTKNARCSYLTQNNLLNQDDWAVLTQAVACSVV